MQTPRRLIPLICLFAACSPEREDIDLGAVPSADAKSDLTALEIPLSLSGGHSTPLFHIAADDPFTVRVVQTTSNAQAELRVLTPTGPTQSAVGTQPLISIQPTTGGTLSYSIQITNLSSFQLLSGTLVISAGGGGGETTKLTLEGYVSGSDAGSSDSAKQSWEAQCEAWRQVQFAISGAEHIESYQCNEPTQVGTSQWRYESEPTVVVVTKVPSGGDPLLTSLSIEGGPAGSQSSALALWRDACNDHALDQKALFGDRLIAASCPKPTQIGTSQWNYRGDSDVYLRPPVGGTVALPGYVSGKFAGSRESALADWKLECDSWAASQFERSGADRIASYSCGEAIQVGTSQWRFESVTEVVLATQLPAGQVPTPVSQTVEGSSQGSQESALASWRAACEAGLDQQASVWDARFLGGACPKPTQVGTSQWRYRGPLEVRLLPL